ncbi:MAG: hypothetical protein QHJ82_05675 [Verrucomicrobiota bacterium]|nr:hypothetical protein [Verrucomicrobiota bacterium]
MNENIIAAAGTVFPDVFGDSAIIAALLQRVGKSNNAGSAAVLGRINTKTDLAPVSIRQIRCPNIHRLGAGKNARAPIQGGV